MAMKTLKQKSKRVVLGFVGLAKETPVATGAESMSSSSCCLFSINWMDRSPSDCSGMVFC